LILPRHARARSESPTASSRQNVTRNIPTNIMTQIKNFIARNKRTLREISVFYLIVVLLTVILAIQINEDKDGTGLIAIAIISVFSGIILLITIYVRKIYRNAFKDLIPLTLLLVLPLTILCYLCGLI